MPSNLTGLILIVDDQPTNLEVICATLAATGLEVAIATSGERALQQIAHEKPDLILLDIMMPGLDGFATCQKLKANPATHDIPVIFMTALADTQSKVTAVELGAVDYVTKPFHEQEVLARVRTHLQLSRLTQNLEQAVHQATAELQASRAAAADQEVAIAREQEQFAQERAVELAKANAILQRTAAQMVDVQDLDRFLHTLLLEVAQELGAASNAIFLYDRQLDVCRMHYAVYDGQVIDLQTDPRFELWQTAVVPADNPNWLRIQSEGHIWCVLKPDPGGAALCDFAMVWHRKMQHRAVMCMRLQLGDEPLGYMGLFFREPVQPSPERIRLIQTLANQATLAIQLTRLSEEAKQTAIAREQERAARERADELATANAALSRSIGQLTSVSKLGCFLDNVLIEAVQASGAVSGAIFLHDIECDGLVNRSHVLHGKLLDVEHDPRNAAFRDPIPANRSLAWQTITADQKIFWIDFQHVDPLECPHLKAWHDATGHRFVAAVPILQGLQVIGFMALAFAQTISVQPALAKLNLCQVLAQQAALAVRLTQLSDQAQQTAILDERNRMARDIHDTLAQSFTSILMRLQTAELALQDDAVATQHNLQIAGDLARQGLAEARRSVYALRPQSLEQENFSEALKRCLQTLVAPAQIAAEYRVTGKLRPLPDHVENELLRIAQEAIGNACNHAAASKIDVQLVFSPSQVCLVVRDNGKGFVPSDIETRQGFGLISMQERAQHLGGKFSLCSQPGQGTEIIVEVELPR